MEEKDCQNTKSSLINKEFKCLDKGFIRIVDLMGDDAAVVQAARVSYGKGTKSISDDTKLIRYLVRHSHTSPLEMCEIKLHIKMPLYVFGQWVRHRTASLNCVSYRYSEVPNEFHMIDENGWRCQSEDNKQGSSDAEMSPDAIRTLMEEQNFTIDVSTVVYNHRLSSGVAREQARKDMPQSVYTEFYWKIDLHNLLHFLRLRTDSHAQLEIREYANVILDEIVSEWCPITYRAFLDYKKHSMNLSSIEKNTIKLICSGKPAEAIYYLKELGFLEYSESHKIKQNRELKELEEKLNSLGILLPWSH